MSVWRDFRKGWIYIQDQNVFKVNPSRKFHRFLIPRTSDGRSKVFKNWDGSDGWVVTPRTNPSKFRRDFASGKSHSASLLLFHSYSTSQRLLSCIHSILTAAMFWTSTFIHSLPSWPSPFRFWTFSLLEDPIKIWNFFRGASERHSSKPMNSLAPS